MYKNLTTLTPGVKIECFQCKEEVFPQKECVFTVENGENALIIFTYHLKCAPPEALT